MNLYFEKFQATGNDFVILNYEEVHSSQHSVWASQLCDRNYGVGADGLIVARNINDGSLVMEFFNPDGTRDVCGNGLRAVALWRYRQVPFSTLNISIDSGNALITKISVENDREGVFLSEIPIKKRPEEITLAVGDKRLRGFYCEMGTPHFVIEVNELPTDDEFRFLGEILESHGGLKERVSVDWFVQNEDCADVRIWERSCGETLSCGTGASAVALCMAKNSASSKFIVRCKGGELQASLTENAVNISGGAQFVFSGSFRI